MEEIEECLDIFYDNEGAKKNTRYYSWEYCYLFFKEHSVDLINNDELLDLASLNLAFYLASWGMYRGSSQLLQLDYKIHKNVIKALLETCNPLWGNDFEWTDLQIAQKIIENNYKKYNVNPTQTLITKILMGIFGCTPAYDRYVILGIKKWNKTTNKHIQTTFNKISFNEFKILSKSLAKRDLLLKNIPYPPMKLIDTYFWNLGKNNG